MAIFELQGPDGAIYEVDAPDENAAIGAFQQMFQPQQPQERPQSQIIMDQYEAAVAAGDNAAADRLLKEATYAATQDGSAPESVTYNPNTGRMVDLDLKEDPLLFGGRGGAALQGGGQGLGFGAFDETVGAIHGLTGRGTYQQNYDYARDVMRHDLQRSREQHPWIATGAEVAGGVASGLAATGAIPAATTLTGTMGQNIGVGAGLGAIYGFGSGEGEGRVRGALNQGAIGGIAGAAAQPLAWGARKGWNAIANAGRAVRPTASPTSVGNALHGALEGSGQSADDVVNALRMARADGQDVYTLADALGISGQRSLSGAVRQGGQAKQIASDFLDVRQAGQGERVAQFVDDALGIGGKTADATRTGLTESRRVAADAAYGAARSQAGAVNLNKAIGAIDDLLMRDPILGDTPLTRGPMGERLMGVRSQMTSGDAQLIDFNTVLNLKSDLFEQMQRNPRLAATMRPVYSALDDALEGASSGYRAANDSYRAASRVIDQLDEGAAAFRPGRRGADTAAQYAGLSDDAERAAFRAGYGDRALAGVERGAFGANKARPFTSQKSAEEIGAMATDPARFTRQIGRENTMFATRGAALGGSQTADNLADMASTNALARIPTSLMGVLDAGIGAVDSLARGQNAATREAVVRALLSSGNEAAQALAGAVARGQQMTAQQLMLVRALLVGGQQTGAQVPAIR